MTARGPGTLLPRTRDFTLAAIAAAYPSEDMTSTFEALRNELHDHPSLGQMLARLVDGVAVLQADYLRCFDVGKERVPIYETEYGRMRGLSKGKDLADVLGFYEAFGFALADERAGEMPDHLAIELEFYALLLYKQSCLVDDAAGWEIVEDARQKFLRDHLGGFVAALASRPMVSTDPVYGPVTRWCADLVAEECRLAGVVPAPLDFFASDDASEPANCGGCVNIPGLRGKDP